ncbi:MAG: hypothetical protein EBQ85_12080 [Proteobacteria bacterium]|nr:hypothetical protein [Pseudomonadota bacterium]
MWHCYYCRSPLSIEIQKKNRLCPSCGSDLHSCKNCSSYDENLSSKCKEPNSEWVSDRSAQNSCAFFEFISLGQIPADSSELLSEAEKAKKAFQALFR